MATTNTNCNDPDTSLEDWDPMSEEYNSPSFNSYDKGPGVNLPLRDLQDNSKDISKSCTLYVVGIPRELKEDGLKEIFSPYGRVISVHKGSSRSQQYCGKCYGFIELASIAEAQKAMDNLNNRPPLMLKMQFAASKNERKKREEIINEDRHKFFSRHANIQSSLVSVGKNERENIQVTFSQSSDKHQVTHHCLDGDDNMSVSSQYSLALSDTNMRCSILSCYETNGSCIHCQNNVPHTHIIRILGKGRFRESILLDNMERDDEERLCCSCCNAPGKMICSACHEWYCSENCQKLDWPKHRHRCSVQSSTSSVQNGETKKISAFPLKLNSSHKNQGNPPSTKPDAPPSFKMASNFRGNNNTANNKNGSSQASKMNKNINVSKSNHFTTSNTTDGRKPQIPPAVDKSPKLNIPREILIGEHCEVVMVFTTGPDDIWLHKKQNKGLVEQLTSKINLEARNHNLLKERPAVGDYCIAKFSEDGCFYRAQVKEIIRDKCKVHYIDYGNEELIKTNELLCLPSHLTSLPAQAISCALAGIKLTPPKSTFRTVVCEHIKKLIPANEILYATSKGNLDNGKTLVDLYCASGDSVVDLLIQVSDIERFENHEDNNFSSSVLGIQPLSDANVRGKSPNIMSSVSPPKMAQQQVVGVLPSASCSKPFIDTIMKQVTAKQELSFVVVIKESPQKIIMACDVPDYRKMFEIQNEINKASEMGKLQKFTPLKNNFVAALSISDKTWYRALILNVIGDMFKVLYVDYGNEEVVASVKPLSPEHVKCPSALLQCTTAPNLTHEQKSLLESLKEASVIHFFVRSIENDVMQLEIMRDSGVILFGRPWYHGRADHLANTNPVQHASTMSGDTAQSSKSLLHCLYQAKGMKPTRIMASSMKQLSLGDGFDVQVVSGVTVPPICLHIISNNDTLDHLMNDIQNHFSKVILKQYHPLKDEMVCARSTRDNRMYRGRIESLIPSEAKVYLVDYGYVEEVSFDQIHPLPDAFKNQPFFAIGVELDRVPPEYTETFHSEFEQWSFNAQITSQSNPVKVRLIITSPKSGSCLNDLLLETMQQPKRIYYDDFPQLGLSAGQHLQVFICSVASPHDILCIPIEPARKFDDLMGEVAKIGEADTTPYVPEVREMCLVYQERDGEGKWCRATVLDKSGDVLECLLVDIGHVERGVHISNCRQLPPELAIEPRLMVYCALAGAPSNDEWDDTTMEKLRKKLPEGSVVEMSISSLDVDGGDALVSFSNFTLHDIGL